MNIDASLNSFAFRSFRDTADDDYIAARMLYRHQLIPQFHWAALQAIEKYMKCILLLNRIPAIDLGHNVGKALMLLDTKLGFKVDLSATSREFIEHLDRFGQYRYLEMSYYTVGWALDRLDRAVWELRRYCQVIVAKVKLDDGHELDWSVLMLDLIRRSNSKPPQQLRLSGSRLDKVLRNRRHPARAMLIWQNSFFGTRRRTNVRVPRQSHSANAPLALEPDLLDEVSKLVFVPKTAKIAVQHRRSKKKQAV